MILVITYSKLYAAYSKLYAASNASCLQTNFSESCVHLHIKMTKDKSTNGYDRPIGLSPQLPRYHNFGVNFHTLFMKLLMMRFNHHGYTCFRLT